MSPELKNVSDFALFARVVEIGSITQCAANMGFERTTVSRRISALESQLGVRLLERSTTNISVTKAGRRCYEQCAVILRAARDAHSAALEQGVNKSDRPLKIGAPVSMVESFLTSMLEDYKRSNPGVELDLQLVDSWSDENVDAVDLGIALGPVHLKKAWLTKVAKVRQLLCASPQYVASSEELLEPDDLLDHPGIMVENSGSSTTTTFMLGGDQIRTRTNVRFVVPGLLEARQAAIAGLGIASLPYFMCEQQLQEGRLMPVLPNYEPLPRDLLLISPKTARQERGPTSLRLSIESALSGKVL